MIIAQRAQAETVETTQQGDVLLYAGLLALLRVLTGVSMLVVLTVLAQAGLRALPWTEPLPGWLLVLYVLGSSTFYLMTHLAPNDRVSLIGVSLLFDLGMFLAISFFSGGALALFVLLPTFAISIHRNVWSGLMAATVFAAHLPLVWPPTHALGELDAPFQVLLFGLILVILLLWVGLAGSSNSHLVRESARVALHREKLAHDRYRRAHSHAKGIYNITYILSSTLNFESVMRSVFEELLRALPLDAGMVLLIDPETNKMKISSSYGLSKPELEQEVDLRTGQLGRAVARGAPAVLNDLRSEPELAGWPRIAGFGSAIVVPLRSRFELFGVMLIAREQGQYDRDDLELMGAIGNNAIVALQNAQLYQSLREERDRLVSKEDEVRRQLARELHDGPAQTLAVIAMKVEFIKKLLDIAPASGLRELDELASMARKANQEVRSLLFELRPAILDSHGLVAALSSYVQRFPQAELPAIHFQADDLQVRLQPAAETTIFNVVQEAIANARRHARARNVWVNLRQHGNKVVVMVQDDGQGFDVASQQEAAPRRGAYGLLNIRERSASVDADLYVNSDHGRGTTVTLTVPILT